MKTYKHIVYNPHLKNIQIVIQEAQRDEEKNLESDKEWQFLYIRPATEDEWVAIFSKDI